MSRQVLTNKKFYKKNFKELFGDDLRRSDLRGVSALDCNFDDVDMSEALCEGANFYGSSFVGTRMHSTNMKDAILANTTLDPSEAFGMIVSLKCGTFERTKVSKDWFLKLLYLISLMECEDKSLSDGLIALIGAETYVTLQQSFKNRAI